MFLQIYIRMHQYFRAPFDYFIELRITRRHLLDGDLMADDEAKVRFTVDDHFAEVAV